MNGYLKLKNMDFFLYKYIYFYNFDNINNYYYYLNYLFI